MWNNMHILWMDKCMLFIIICLGPLLLTWFNFNPSMDKQLHPLWSVGWNYLSIPKLQRCNRWSLGMDKQFHLTLYQTCNYLSMLGLKLNHVKKGLLEVKCVRKTRYEKSVSSKYFLYNKMYNKWNKHTKFSLYLIFVPANEVGRGHRKGERASVHLWTESCPLCIFHNILTGSISYLPSYQGTSEGVPCVNIFCKIPKFEFLAIFKICNFDFILFWLGIQYESIVWTNMGRRVVFSECWCSSYSSSRIFYMISFKIYYLLFPQFDKLTNTTCWTYST